MTPLNVLGELEILGKDVAQEVNPHYWSHHQEMYSQKAKQELNKFRLAYRQIRAGEDPIIILTQLKKMIPGIRGNRINLMILALTGQLEKCWRINDQGMIKFQEKDF